jgi:ribose 5-phosphate isomerase B
MMRIGIAADHGGFIMKEQIADWLRRSGYDVVDFGAFQLDPDDDYPDFIIPLAEAVAAGEVERGVALCGSGIGASIAANKVAGVRAGLIHDIFSARQGVEDDDMNVFCLGGEVIGSALAWELLEAFLAAHFTGALRHQRRLAKVQALANHHPSKPIPMSRFIERLGYSHDFSPLTGNNHENCNQSDGEASRNGSEPVARQHYPKPAD